MVKLYDEIIKMNGRGEPGILITVIDKKGHGPAIVGKKLLIDSSGTIKGTIGGGELEFLAVEKAKKLIDEKRSMVLSFDMMGEYTIDGHKNTDMICGGYVTLFFEYIPITPTIYIFGAGHVGKALIYHLANLDYQIAVIDYKSKACKDVLGSFKITQQNYKEFIDKEKINEESYVIIAEYNHEIDYEILKSIYEHKWKPKYIGLLSSPKKAKVMINKLKADLGSHIDISMLYSPVGLDIGAKSPEEIAISIISEILAVRYEKLWLYENKILQSGL